MSTVSFSGLASGIQWGDLLDQLEKAETLRRVGTIENRAALERQRIQTFGSFRTLVNNLVSAAAALRDGTPFGAVTASVGTSGGVAPFAVTAGTGAHPGTRTVEVVSLAQADAWASGTHAAPADALGFEGGFTLNGVTIEVGVEDSLDAIRDRINVADAGVRASVLRVDDGQYRLTLTSTTTGAAGISFTDGTGDVGAALGLARTRAGSDAVLRIDDITVTRTTNTISDAIEGLTLELSQVGGPVTVQVARNDQALVSATRDFANAYNAIRAFVDDQNSSAARPLIRDPILRQALNSFKSVVFADAADPDAGALNRLALAGVAVDRQGRLQVDDARVKALAGSDSAGLRALFADVGGRMATSAEDVARAETGAIAGRTRSMNEVVMRLGRQADDARLRVARMIDRMTKDFLRMEDALGRINAQGNWLTGQIDSLYRPPRN